MEGQQLRNVDVDGHVTEPADLWERYLPAELRARAIRIEQNDQGWEYLSVDNRPSVMRPGIMGILGGIGMDARELLTPGKVSYRDACPAAGYDGTARLTVMDAEKIDYALVYPTLGLLWERDVTDARLAAAYARAYNDWVFDYCAANPRRLGVVGQISLKDVDLAVAEVKRVAARGAKAVFLQPERVNGVRPSDPHFDPFWRACVETGLPVGLHVIARPPTECAVPCWFGGTNYVHHVGITFPSDVMYCFTHALMEGLFERHPKLRMVLLEAGGGWVYSFLERLDHKMKMFSWATSLKRLPSEYFHDNVWVSIDPDEATTEPMAKLLGANKLMWASDYPHADGQMGVVDELYEMTPHMAEADRNLILGENAVRLYKL